MTVYRHVDSRFPFLWESENQPAARWNRDGEGPAQYLADTPDGAWAELLRHEGITDPADLVGIERDLWAINLLPEDEPLVDPALPREVMEGGLATYPVCQAEAQRLRGLGVTGFAAPSAALLPGLACGWRTEGGGLQAAKVRDGRVIVLFGARPDLVGWRACSRGRPDSRILPKVRHLENDRPD